LVTGQADRPQKHLSGKATNRDLVAKDCS